MIAGTILMAVFMGLLVLSVSISVSLFICIVLDELISLMGKYVNWKRVVLFVIFLVLTYFFYMGIADWILMIIG